MQNRRLTRSFNLEDMLLSETALREGIDNTPAAEGVIDRLSLLAVEILEKVADQFDTRPQVSSGYRCPVLNARVGGAANSQHLRGEAVDFEMPGVPLLEVARWMAGTLDYDQLLLERAGGKSWIHCSYISSTANRREVKWFDGAAWHEGLPEA